MDDDYRASDADRERVVALLEAHCGAGRLGLDETLRRSGSARVAVTRSELAVLLADLPEETSPAQRGWRDRGWRTHASVAALTTGGVIGLWQLTRDRHPAPQDYGQDYWWPLWFGLIWAVVVLLHYLYVAGLLSLPARPVQPIRPSAPDPPDPLDRLTQREREILALVGEGCANKEIARRLFISERTARTHVSNILRKLELPSRTQAALLAVRAGLTDTNQD